jgi:hypothetical protein
MDGEEEEKDSPMSPSQASKKNGNTIFKDDVYEQLANTSVMLMDCACCS